MASPYHTKLQQRYNRMEVVDESTGSVLAVFDENGVWPANTAAFLASIDTDPLLGGLLASNGKIPSQRAAKVYVDTGLALHVPKTYMDADETLSSNSDTLLATQKATKTYVDTAIANVNGNNVPMAYLDTDGTLAANSDVRIATQKATKTYVDASISTAVADHSKCSTSMPVPIFHVSDSLDKGFLYNGTQFAAYGFSATSDGDLAVNFRVPNDYDSTYPSSLRLSIFVTPTSGDGVAYFRRRVCWSNAGDTDIIFQNDFEYGDVMITFGGATDKHMRTVIMDLPANLKPGSTAVFATISRLANSEAEDTLNDRVYADCAYFLYVRREIYVS